MSFITLPKDDPKVEVVTLINCIYSRVIKYSSSCIHDMVLFIKVYASNNKFLKKKAFGEGYA